MKKAIYYLLFALMGAGGCTSKCDPINAELTGRWERIDGDNSPFNGMVVEFVGTSAPLLTIPSTAPGFIIGDLKWRNVVKERDGVFVLQDRDSAGGYVNSRILIMADGKEMMLSAQRISAGSYQKWKRL